MTQIKALLAGWRKQYVIFMGKPMFELEPIAMQQPKGMFCSRCGCSIRRGDHYKVSNVLHVNCDNPKLEKPQ